MNRNGTRAWDPADRLIVVACGPRNPGGQAGGEEHEAAAALRKRGEREIARLLGGMRPEDGSEGRPE